ncbi:MAG TPA: hypothetical protein VFV14_07850 [Myxococcaceae bacterium]|nr:hypothetical protein [Myxococcaceae bacterium]
MARLVAVALLSQLTIHFFADDQARQLGGIRFDVIDALAVKLEGGNVRIYGSNGPYARFQVAFVY